jgi:16S rRNA (guanine527-N7)-methyltransferase
VPDRLDPDRLDEVLRRAQDLGLLGPGPVGTQREHAEAFCLLVLDGLAGGSGGALRWLDLGSGGGLPGFVLAGAAPQSTGILLDSRQRSTHFLEEAVETLELTDRVEVVTARAEAAARDPAHRERYDLVVARSLAPPAITAECATAFLKPGARLAVSEPPEASDDRWNEAKLAELGLSAPEIVHGEGATAALLAKQGPTPQKYPRKPGIPTKRPLW